MKPLPTVTRPVKERIAYFDNARYVILVMVVVGHSLTILRGNNQLASGIYDWMYVFHMPAFILISGYIARNYVGDARQVQRMVATLLLPYLLVETTMQLITRYYTGSPDPLRILSPQWLAWFIIALFLWRLTTPIWRALRYPITTSIVISLLVGLIEVPNVLALPKVLALMPFYVIGLSLSLDDFKRLRQGWVRVVSLAILVGSFVYAYLYSSQWTTAWLLWKHRYDEAPLEASPAAGIVQRAQLLILALVLTAAFLSLIPWRKTPFTDLGSRTVYCYLLHGYIILILNEHFDFFEKFTDASNLTVIAIIAVAAIVANLLMLKPVSVLFRPLFEPRQTWMFRADSKPAS